MVILVQYFIQDSINQNTKRSLYILHLDNRFRISEFLRKCFRISSDTRNILFSHSSLKIIKYIITNGVPRIFASTSWRILQSFTELAKIRILFFVEGVQNIFINHFYREWPILPFLSAFQLF